MYIKAKLLNNNNITKMKEIIKYYFTLRLIIYNSNILDKI